MQTDDLARLLRQGIREGALLPGQALLQEELAKRFSVSRIPVRDALLTLAAEGLVKTRPGGGLAVSQLSAEEVEELYDLRIAIEPALAPHVVDNASPRTIASWKQMAADLRGIAATSSEWIEANYQFHLSVYAVTGREHSLRIIRSLLDRTFPYARLFMASIPDSVHAQDDHDEMLAAIEARDAEQLGAVLLAHLQTTQEAVAAFLRAQPPEMVPGR